MLIENIKENNINFSKKISQKSKIVSFKLTDDEKIDRASKKIFIKYHKAFEELAK